MSAGLFGTALRTMKPPSGMPAMILNDFLRASSAASSTNQRRCSSKTGSGSSCARLAKEKTALPMDGTHRFTQSSHGRLTGGPPPGPVAAYCSRCTKWSGCAVTFLTGAAEYGSHSAMTSLSRATPHRTFSPSCRYVAPRSLNMPGTAPASSQ